MTSTPHDALFKAAFEQPEHAAGLFRSVLPASVVEAIAWETMSGERGSFVDRDLAEQHSDLLFSVEIANGQDEAYLYLLLEHQSTDDVGMPLRMLTYLVRVWERFRKERPHDALPPIVPVVVSHAPGGWSAPRSLWEMFAPRVQAVTELERFVPRLDLVIEDLAHLSNDDIKARTLAAFPTLALWLLRDARDADQLMNNLTHWGAAFAEAARTPHGVAALAQLMRYIVVVTDDLQFQVFRDKLIEQAPEADRAAMTIAEQLRQEGREEGLEKGLQKSLIKLLATRFGPMKVEHEHRIATAPLEQLEQWFDAALTADSADEVFGSY